MSLLMDALKKADENLKEKTSQTPDKTDDTINGNDEPLFFETIEDSIPPPQLEQTSESSLKDWNEELLENFKDIDYQTDSGTSPLDQTSDLVNELYSENKVEKKSGTDNWEDDILQQFQHDNEEKSEQKSEVDEVEPLETESKTDVQEFEQAQDDTIFPDELEEQQEELKTDLQESEQAQDDTIFPEELEEQQEELKTDVQESEQAQDYTISDELEQELKNELQEFEQILADTALDAVPDWLEKQEEVKTDVQESEHAQDYTISSDELEQQFEQILADTTLDAVPDWLEKQEEVKTDMQKADKAVSKTITEKAHRPRDAQRVLAASTPPSSSKRTTWLYGILGVLLVSMGAGYYYIENYLLPPSFSPRLQRPPLDSAQKGHTQTRGSVKTKSKTPKKLSKTLPETLTQTRRSVKTKSKEPKKWYETLPETLTQTRRSVKTKSKKPKKRYKTLPETSTQTLGSVNTQSKEPEKQNTLPETSTQTLGSIKTQSKKPKKQNTLPKTQPAQVSQQPPPAIEEVKKPERSTKAQKTEKLNTPIYPSIQHQPIILDKNFERVQKRHTTTPSQKSPSQKSPQKSAPSKKEKQEVPLLPPTPGIQIRKTILTKINTELSKGYNAFQRNDDSTAQRAYTKVLQQDENNRDALLGLAAVALRKGNKVQAQQHYQRALHLYPQDTYAQVGLINTLDHYSPETESQLKLLLKKTPQSAYIHFSLGNFYARQGLWAQAQQSYFNAYRYDKNQADYVYNLAISLDYLNQPSLALTYYQHTLELASNQSVHFNPQTVLKRMQTLSAHARALVN